MMYKIIKDNFRKIKNYINTELQLCVCATDNFN